MARKHWIWITITIALIHGLVTMLLAPVSGDIIFTRFEGSPYDSPSDPVWLGIYFLLHFPYFILTAFAGSLRSYPATYFVIWALNSLTWGLLGAWLASQLPFMKGKKDIHPETQEE